MTDPVPDLAALQQRAAERAAALGDLEGSYLLGRCWEDGRGTTQDVARALRRIVENGFGTILLGGPQLYLRGVVRHHDGRRDTEQAAEASL